MSRFLARRVGQAVLVVVAATFLIFMATFALGDPFASSGEKAVPPAIQAADRARFGLDQPLPVQFGHYLANIVTLDFGVDFDQGRPVSQMLAETVPNTVRLALVAIVIDLLIGISAGTVAAIKRYSVWDTLVTVASTVGIGLPVFVIGILLVANVSGHGPFPPVPRSFTVQVPWYREVLLPAVTLAAIDAAFIARLMRGSMLEVLRADYIRTARAKGLTERRVVLRHGIRSAITPIVTAAGLDIGILLGGAILTETVFNIPGIGRLAYESIQNSDLPMIQGTVLMGAFFIILANLVVDIGYAVIDPRVRYS
jgi:oligopeptide transport system permease protein